MRTRTRSVEAPRIRSEPRAIPTRSVEAPRTLPASARLTPTCTAATRRTMHGEERRIPTCTVAPRREVMGLEPCIRPRTEPLRTHRRTARPPRTTATIRLPPSGTTRQGAITVDTATVLLLPRALLQAPR